MRKNKILCACLASLMALTVFGGCKTETVQKVIETDYSIFNRPRIERPENDYIEWNNLNNWTVFYGPWQDEMLEFDAVVCEGFSLTKEDFQKLKDNHVYSLAYISVGEELGLHKGDGLGPSGDASYYIYDESDKPKANGTWGTYFTDARSPVWQAKILAKMDELLERGADGVFLDTVDTITIFPDTADGMADMIIRMKQAHPDAKIVTNRGVSILDRIGKYIDGMMWESFMTLYDFTDMSYNFCLEGANRQYCINAAKKINEARQKNYWPVLSLEYYDPEMTAAVQICYDKNYEYDFIPYVMPMDLSTKIYVHREEYGNNESPRIQPKSERGKYALGGEIIGKQYPKNSDVSEKNLAYAENGAKVEVDSIYGGYVTDKLNDGYANLPEHEWVDRGWASAENDKEHWIQVTLPSEKTVSKAIIHWCLDGSSYMSSKEVTIQAMVNGEWVDLKTVTDIENQTKFTELEFEATKAKEFRFYQGSGKGSAARPNIFWVSEVLLYE